MPLEIVFLEPQNWRPLKPHYKIPITAFTDLFPQQKNSSRQGLCWVRAASGPFFGEQFIST